MFSRKATSLSTIDYSQAVERLKRELDEASAVLIGAGSGLSAATGHTYSGERFEKNFADFIAKYHYRDMYSAGFHPYPTPEEYWAYWSRHIYLNRYAQDSGPVYSNLLELMDGKDYFAITTNVDHSFQKAGYDKQRLFYTQGDYGLWQCGEPCHKETYDNENVILRMVAEQHDMRIPSELIPYCPKCGRPMTNNLRCDDSFVEDAGWHLAAKRYEYFIHSHENLHILFLELGVGGNTPGIIKYPFWKMTYQNKKAVYACINLGEAFAPLEIEQQSVCINADIRDVLSDLKN